MFDKMFAIDQFDGSRRERQAVRQIPSNHAPVVIHVNVRPTIEDVVSTRNMEAP
jgi:hypothetical protein